MKLLTTSEAAKRLGVHVTRVRALITAQRLPAQKLGRDYVIREADLKLVEDRKPGRPPKTAGRREKVTAKS
jgi:excisionase family DNA binding protein